MTSEIELTKEDLQAIQQQCENQGATSPAEIAGFTDAYRLAKNWSARADWDKGVPAEEIVDLARLLGTLTDPRNLNGFRQIPVLFASGNHGVSHHLLDRAMRHWAEAVVEGRLAPVDVYREFELIHPFEDGNGRVGDLFWKIATQRVTGRWLAQLPPETFDPENDPTQEKKH